MSDRYHEECQRREVYEEKDVQTGEVNLLIPEHVMEEIEREMQDPDSKGLHTGLYL